MAIHARDRLSDRRVKSLKEPGHYEDGAGLRLVISPSGTKRWVVRATLNGRRVNRGLGSFPGTSLAEARDLAAAIRAAARRGVDLRAPDIGQPSSPPAAPTFRDAFDAFWAIKSQQLNNRHSLVQWPRSLDLYVMPFIGNRPVAEIEPDEIISVLRRENLWFEKPDVGKRLLQRMEAVFLSAITRRLRTTASPCIGVAELLGVDHRSAQHQPALPFDMVAPFIAELRTSTQMWPFTPLAMVWLILTASRSIEARGATWEEVDLDGGLWTVPVERLKGRKAKHGPHIVPLSRQAIGVAREAAEFQRQRGLQSALVFPGTKGQILARHTVSALMSTRDLPGVPHGFRSTFRTWVADFCPDVPEVVAEAALSHVPSNAVVVAYRRTQYLEPRVKLMQRWADAVMPTVPLIAT